MEELNAREKVAMRVAVPAQAEHRHWRTGWGIACRNGFFFSSLVFAHFSKYFLVYLFGAEQAR